MKNNTFWNGKCVAVTGSSGFVGSAIVEKLKLMNVPVIEISRRSGVDILNFSQLVEALKPVNYIISTAAVDGNADFKEKNSSFILEENIKIVSHILAAASQNDIHDITLLSSAVVYGPSQSGYYSEDYDLTQHGYTNLGGYALSKRITELLGTDYATKYGGKVFLPRPTNIYGKNDPHQRVIETISRKIRNDEVVEIFGTGNELRSYIFLDDFVEILLRLIELGVEGVMNVSGPEKIKVIDLAHSIGKSLGKEPKITFVHQTAPTSDRVLDIRRLESRIQYTYTPLEEGLMRTLSSTEEKDTK